MRVRLEFKPADCWIGVYWRHDEPYWRATHPPQLWEQRHVWICLVPMLPIHFSWKVLLGTALGED